MPLNLFSDSKYYKFNELYKRYHEELYSYLKERKFILSNEHYLTHWRKQATIAITMFESRCIYDVSENQREEWHEFSIYQIEFRPTTITFKFDEEYNQDEFNADEMKQEYDLYIEIRDYLKDLFNRYKTEYMSIKEME